MTKHYVLMLETLVHGAELAERDGDGRPVLYATRAEAEAEVADAMSEQYRQVIEGVRTLDEVGEPDWVEEVTLTETGDIVGWSGRVLGNVGRVRD